MRESLLIRRLPPRAMTIALLQAADLPTEDLGNESLEHFFYVGSDGSPSALVGLEIYGREALLRSLIVEKAHRGGGFGAALVAHAERYAATKGVRSVYLLTTTAEAFFKKLRYLSADRSSAPSSIQQTREYTSLCPQSAAFMVKQLYPSDPNGEPIAAEAAVIKSEFSNDTDVCAKPHKVLFLCTGNSARSVLAESLLNHWGEGKFIAFSAGSFPKGQVNPIAIDLLGHMNMPTQGLRSKSWDEYTTPGAPPIDFIFTVCDNAAGEACPVWPGKPMTAHWGVADPAAVQGSELEKARAFRKTFIELEARIKLLVNLPIGSLDASSLKAKLKEIGNSEVATLCAGRCSPKVWDRCCSAQRSSVLGSWPSDWPTAMLLLCYLPTPQRRLRVSAKVILTPSTK